MLSLVHTPPFPVVETRPLCPSESPQSSPTGLCMVAPDRPHQTERYSPTHPSTHARPLDHIFTNKQICACAGHSRSTCACRHVSRELGCLKRMDTEINVPRQNQMSFQSDDEFKIFKILHDNHFSLLIFSCPKE